MLQKSNILYSRQQNVFIPDEKRFCFRTFNNLLEWHGNLTGTEGPQVLNVTWQRTIKINAWLKYCWSVLFDYDHWNNEREKKKEKLVSRTQDSVLHFRKSKQWTSLPSCSLDVITLSKIALFRNPGNNEIYTCMSHLCSTHFVNILLKTKLYSFNP